MQRLELPEGSDPLVRANHGTKREAKFFWREPPDFTPRKQRNSKAAPVGHVAGPELLEGVRQYALKEFGPMALSVLSHWGVTRCEDVGHMVFNLIGAGIFGKTDEDSMDDFKAVYDFRDAFVKPFQPEPAVTGKKVSLGLPAPKAS